MNNDFIAIAKERGFLHQITDEENLALRLKRGGVPAYIGYDATASSLHVGSLVSIMLLRWYQRCGQRPIILMGGGTTRIGDPSGRDSSRQILSLADIHANLQSIQQIFAKYLDFGDGPSGAIMANNADWLADLNYIEFLRDYGKHFSVNRMLSFDSVKLRLEREQTLSFLEFNYMILQAYDFLELSRRYDCALQMGGSDQWGNIVNGIELARRAENRELFGLTVPLLTTASGAKMGKTADGAVWLNQEKLSAYDYWQYWRNCEDADVGRFLKLFTELPLDEIAKLAALGGQEINQAKIILADEATSLCHGKEAAVAARQTAETTFGEGGIGADLPRIEVAKDSMANGSLGLLQALVMTGLAASNGEARRHVLGGAIRIHGHAQSDASLRLDSSHLNDQGEILLSNGRKRHAVLVVK